MLLSDSEVTTRLESPENLINRLKQKMRAVGIQSAVLPPHERTKASVVTAPPSIDELVDNIDGKLALTSLQDKAVEIMRKSMDELSVRLNEVTRPEKLANIAADMGRLVQNVREQRNQTNNIQVMVYAPQLRTEESFDVIDLKDGEVR